MNIETDKIIAQEYAWIGQNEPSFRVHGSIVTGKIGRTSDGDSITMQIEIPQYYPIVRPEVKILSPISHPNIGSSGSLSLQVLDEWEPDYRLKDVISATRRLFIRSARVISKKVASVSPNTGKSKYERDIMELQAEIAKYNRTITEIKSKQLQEAGVKAVGIGAFKVSKQLDLKCQLLALNDLLELVQDKFEEADIDQTDFFRLYRKYIKEQYITQHELNKLKEDTNVVYKKKTEKPIRN